MKTRYECPDCGKFLSSSSSLKQHRRIHSDIKPWYCSICSKGFNQKEKYLEHEARHRKAYRFHCSKCPKKFFQKDRLKTHEKDHSGVREFVCEDCGLEFRRKYELNKHRKMHNQQEKERLKKVECPICQKKNYSHAELKIHMIKHSNEKNFQCNTCSKAFKHKDSLRNHTISSHGYL